MMGFSMLSSMHRCVLEIAVGSMSLALQSCTFIQASVHHNLWHELLTRTN